MGEFLLVEFVHHPYWRLKVYRGEDAYVCGVNNIMDCDESLREYGLEEFEVCILFGFFFQKNLLSWKYAIVVQWDTEIWEIKYTSFFMNVGSLLHVGDHVMGCECMFVVHLWGGWKGIQISWLCAR